MSATLRYGLIPLLLCCHTLIHAQEYTMNAGNITACEGAFFDSGGQSGNYSAGESLVTTICSDGSSGSHIRMFFASLQLASGDTLFFYDGADTTANRFNFLAPSFNGKPYIIQSTAANPGGCLTIQFKSDMLEDSLGWSATFQCIQSCQNIQSAIVSSAPDIMPADTGYVNSCPGNLIQLTGGGIYPQNYLTYPQSDETSSFLWDMGDGTVFEGQSVAHRYEEPGGYIVQLTVTDSKGCTNTNFLHQRIRIAEEPVVTFDSEVQEICLGEQLSTAMTSITPQEGAFTIRGYRADSLELPDGNGTSYETSIEFTQFSPGQTLTSGDDILSVCVNMEHSWLRDLEIDLTCPSGKSIVLHNFAGQEGSGIFLGQPVDFDGTDPTPGKGYDYCWTPNANNGTWLEYIDQYLFNEDTLPAGDYAPYQSFDNLIGCPLNGKWTIEVRDLWSWDNGYIFSWGINFDAALFPTEENFTPNITDYYWSANVEPSSQTPASITHVPLLAGPFNSTFHVMDDYGCSWDTTFNFVALPPKSPECISCSDLVSLSPDTMVCDGGSVQIQGGPADGILKDQITFRALPAYAFNNDNHPLSNPYINGLEVSGVVPEVLEDPLEQIESVCINLEAPLAASIHLYLQAPNGRIVELSTANGGNSANYQNICFSPKSARKLEDSELPLSGTYAAEGDWDILKNSNANGVWRLLIADDATTGVANLLQSWSINFHLFNKVNYFWSPATGLSCTTCPNPIASPKSTRTYTLMTQDSYGCIDTDTIRIRVVTNEQPITLDSVGIKMPSCFGRNDGSATVFASGGSGSFSYVWSDSLQQFSQKAVLLEAGNYGITITDSIGCRLSETIAINQPDSLTLDFFTSDVLCKGGNSGSATAIPEGGTGPFSFLWNNQQSQASATNLQAGTYSVSVTDANGCPAQSQVRVEEPEFALQLNITQTDSGCYGEANNEATALPSGGTGDAYTFVWSDGQEGAVATKLDSLIYRVTVTDVNGCEAESALQIRDLQPIDFNIIKNEPSCYGYSDGGMGINIITGGAGNEISDYSINWSTGASGIFIENLAANQTYGVTVTDSKGCTAARERFLEEPQTLQVSFDISPVKCFGDATGSATITGLPGTPSQYQFSWDQATGNQSGQTASNLAAGTYSVTIIEPGACVNTAVVSIPEPLPLNVTIQTQSNRCFGDSEGLIEVVASGGTPSYNYSWSNGESTASIRQLAAGTYTLTLSDKNACTINTQATVSQPQGLSASIAITDPSCYDSRNGRASITVNGGTGPFLYSTDNSTYSPSPVFAGLTRGTYTLYIQDFNDCIFQEPFTVNAPPAFTVEARAEETFIFQGDSVRLSVFPQNSQGEILYTWSAPDLSTLSCSVCSAPVTKPLFSTGYRVDAIDDKGCEASDRITITVAKPTDIAVPTGFTPNGDGVNDILNVHGRTGATVKVFRIFDRWGELLYETGDFEVNDLTRGWDGTYRGEALMSGVYIWHLVALYPDGSEEPFQGQTTLIR